MKRILVLILLIIVFIGVNVYAAQRAGYIMSVMGNKDGSVLRLDDAKAVNGKKLEKNAVVYFGDILITKDVMVKIILDHYEDNPLFVMKSNTKIQFEKKKNKKGGVFSFFGKLFFKGNGKDHRGFRIITSNAIAGIEGTQLSVTNIGGKTKVSVFEGKVYVEGRSAEKNKVNLKAGQYTVCGPDFIPEVPKSITEQENWLGMMMPSRIENIAVETVERMIEVQDNPDVAEVEITKTPVGKPVKGDLNDNGELDSVDSEMATWYLLPNGERLVKIKLSGKGCNKHGLFLKSGELDKVAFEKFADMNNDGKIDDKDAKVLDILYRADYDINKDGVLNADDVAALKEKVDYDKSTQNKLGNEKISGNTLEKIIAELKKLNYNPEFRQ